MGRTIPSALNTHLQGGVLTLATLWKLTTTAGTVYGYTSHVADLIVGGVTYTSAQGMTPSSLKISLGQGVDNLNIEAVFTSAGITEANLRAGELDKATVVVSLVNYQSVSDGVVVLMSGRLGEVTIRNGQFEAELRGLIQHARQQIGWITSPTCRWEFGGTECGFIVVSHLATVTTRTSDRVIRATALIGSPDNTFAYGKLTWTSGLNNGRSIEVKKSTNSNGELEFTTAMPYTVQVGDTFSVQEGCDRLWPTCKAKLNQARFGGEPHVPGLDSVLRRPPN